MITNAELQAADLNTLLGAHFIATDAIETLVIQLFHQSYMNEDIPVPIGQV